MKPWPHQERGVRGVLEAFEAGIRRVCLTSPTGGGKTYMVQDIARTFLACGKRVALYSNRLFLIDQLTDVLAKAGILHGNRASGQEELHEHPFQVCSFQTEVSRVLKRQTMDLHACGPGDLAIIDEGHLHLSEKAREVRARHVAGGAFTLDVTATPLEMSLVCDQLVVAGTPSELRACAALVPFVHYGCDEPDLRAFKKMREGEDLTEKQQRSAMMTPGIMGRVWKWYTQLNPSGKPALLFGPGVGDSLWFAEQFEAKGVKAAHIDGDDIWVDGQWYESDSEKRREVSERSKSGDIKVVCNRFVLREGIDWPWIEHLILCFIAGSLQTYLQTGGRGGRASVGKTECIVQDHGGMWWRHGSLNEDRLWDLRDTPNSAYGLRANRLREKKQREPFLCPRCQRVWIGGKVCSPALGGCGMVLDATKKSRPVVSTDGTLHELSGDVFKPRRVYTRPDGPEIWKRMYFRSCSEKGRRTFAAAAALFAQENYWAWPDRQWPFMPNQDEKDWYRHCADVPRDRLG